MSVAYGTVARLRMALFVASLNAKEEPLVPGARLLARLYDRDFTRAQRLGLFSIAWRVLLAAAVFYVSATDSVLRRALPLLCTAVGRVYRGQPPSQLERVRRGAAVLAW